MQSEGADVEPEQNENEAGMKYEEVMSETGVDPKLLALRSNQRREPRIGIGIRHLGLTFVVYAVTVCVLLIFVLAELGWHRHWRDIAVLAGVCIVLIALYVALSFWRRRRERGEWLRAENQIEADNESSDSRHPGP